MQIAQSGRNGLAGTVSQQREDVPRLDDVIEWDVTSWSKALPFWLDHSKIKTARRPRALELGTRNGGLSLWLASKGFDVVCSDVERPSSQAMSLHERYHVTNRIAYEPIDASNIKVHGQFDVVCFKSMLGAVGRQGFDVQRRAVREMFRVLRPGGEVWFAENLAASPLHRFLRRTFVPWARSWRYLTLAELQELFASFGSCEIITAGFLAAFGRTERQRRMLARLDGSPLLRLFPPTWRYIAIGVARKDGREVT